MRHKSPANTQTDSIELKQRQFNAAMELFASNPVYIRFGRMVSLANISLQALFLALAMPFTLGPIRQFAAFLAAVVIADFLNGFVHMMMDNNDDYTSAAGPLVAGFHLHHKTPQYVVRPLPVVYFLETGSKVWMVPFLGAGVLLALNGALPAIAIWAWFYIGVLSSMAEVAHYSCHVPDTLVPRLLRSARLFISKKHHARHHIEDNRHYAFLNGFTDPLLNSIARRFFPGYKNTTDRHYALYKGPNTENREAVA